MKFMQIWAQDLRKLNMASKKGKSLKIRSKYDIYEEYLDVNTHVGVWDVFRFTLENVRALNSLEC